MTEIVERLRGFLAHNYVFKDGDVPLYWVLISESIGEIERLRAANKLLVERVLELELPHD